MSLAAGVEIYFLARNFGGAVNQPSDEQVFAFHFGGSLSSTDVGNLYSRLNDFKTAVGA